MTCGHKILQLTPSPFAELAGFEQPGLKERIAAESRSGKIPSRLINTSIETFPGPLVLPHDDLNYDPDSPGQDFKEWQSAKTRNKMTDKDRGTLYVVQVPTIEKQMEFMRNWTIPKDQTKLPIEHAASPNANLFVDYLKAFYHGLNVSMFPDRLSWTAWGKHSQPRRAVSLPKFVGLAHGDACTRIRVRSPPDGIFTAQVNLDDIIDAMIQMLPEDAYAMVLLIDHDMYENDDDDFCCGRAYGGSRVAVVQTARYNPHLDASAGIDRDHMWPMSHCKDFIDGLCAAEDVKPRPPRKQQIASSKQGPMRAAVDAAMLHPQVSDSTQDFQALWFSRLARTVSHELGHCFGIAHCVYYACNMQGTAGMKEDVRQPPYLCPVCEAKVYHAVAGEWYAGNQEKGAWVLQRSAALSAFCRSLEGESMTSAMWRGLEGWYQERF